MDYGPWAMDYGPWTMDHGLWTMGHGLWTMEYGTWTMDHGLWTMVLHRLWNLVPIGVLWGLNIPYNYSTQDHAGIYSQIS